MSEVPTGQSRSPAITLADDIHRLFFSKEGYVPSEDRFWKADEWRLVMAALRAYGSSETGKLDVAELREKISDAAYEWAKYVHEDTAPVNLVTHMEAAFDAAMSASRERGQSK